MGGYYNSDYFFIQLLTRADSHVSGRLSTLKVQGPGYFIPHKRFGYLIVFTLMSLTMRAQHHFDGWLRATVGSALTERIRVDAEFQYRKQNGYDNIRLLDKNLMIAFRPWVYFKQSEHVEYGLSPLAYFKNYNIIRTPQDYLKKPQNELRVTLAADFHHGLTEKLYLVNRPALEYRIFEGSTGDVLRMRYRIGLQYKFTPKIGIMPFEELFLNLHGAGQDHFFDHNRIGLSMAYKPCPLFKVETGYIHINRKPRNDVTIVQEENFFLNFTFQLPKGKRKNSKGLS